MWKSGRNLIEIYLILGNLFFINIKIFGFIDEDWLVDPALIIPNSTNGWRTSISEPDGKISTVTSFKDIEPALVK